LKIIQKILYIQTRLFSKLVNIIPGHPGHPIKKYINLSIHQFQPTTIPSICSESLQKLANQKRKILLVLDNIKNGCIKSIRAAAKLYNILRSTLQIYIYSIFSIAEKYNSGYKLI